MTHVAECDHNYGGGDMISTVYTLSTLPDRAPYGLHHGGMMAHKDSQRGRILGAQYEVFTPQHRKPVHSGGRPEYWNAEWRAELGAWIDAKRGRLTALAQAVNARRSSLQSYLASHRSRPPLGMRDKCRAAMLVLG